MPTTNDSNDNNNNKPTFDTGLIRKLLLKDSQKRITKDAVLATSELLRLFVLETRSRASIEAECEAEGTMQQNTTADSDDDEEGGKRVLIRDDHITKVAAELLMDFS